MGSGQVRKLLQYQRIAIDTNVFIYALEGNEDFPETTQLLQGLTHSTKKMYTSAMTLAEIMVPLFRGGQLDRIPDYLDFVAGQGRIMIIDADQTVALRAAQLRARHGLKTPDAFHLATALQCRANVFVTADREYGPAKIEHMAIATLKPRRSKAQV